LPLDLLLDLPDLPLDFPDLPLDFPDFPQSTDCAGHTQVTTSSLITISSLVDELTGIVICTGGVAGTGIYFGGDATGTSFIITTGSGWFGSTADAVGTARGTSTIVGTVGAAIGTFTAADGTGFAIGTGLGTAIGTLIT